MSSRQFKLSEKERIYFRTKLKEYRLNHPKAYEELLEYSKTRYHRIKNELKELLGSECVRCGYGVWEILQIDHINGGGTWEQEKEFGSNSAMYSYYIKYPNEAKKRLQLLCPNCNWLKRMENKEYRKRASYYKLKRNSDKGSSLKLNIEDKGENV